MSKRPGSPIDVSPPPLRDRTPLIIEHVFTSPGESEYRLELQPAGIIFDVNRLRRSSHELWGELSVSLMNGHFPNARTTDAVLLAGDMNFSSVQARATRGKALAERAQVPDLDWHGFVEELAYKVIAAERKGKPSIVLADEPETDEKSDVWDIDGFPILVELPMVLFGRGASGKSYFAMWIAGQLASQGIPVLYADWEFSKKDHRRRYGRLFNPMSKHLHYAHCDRPMRDEAERLQGLIRQHSCQFIICDSMVFALDGKAEDSEQAGNYFRYVRHFGIGSLHLSHTTKGDDDREKEVFGSVFFQNGARSIWFIQRAEVNPKGTIQFGLYHRKSNVGDLLKPRGYRLSFQHNRTLVEKVSIDSVDELAAKLPLLDRMKAQLSKGALTPKVLAEDLDSTANVIRKMVSRHSSIFVRVGNKIGLAVNDVEF